MAKEEKKVENPQAERTIRIFRAAVTILFGCLISYFIYATTVNPESKYPFKFGLDLAGGSHLVYEADLSDVRPEEVSDLMSVLRDVIERRTNIFGVSEPSVYVEESSFVAENPVQRLVVELPGVTDVDEAVEEIGKTPLLEFKLIDQAALAAEQSLESLNASGSEAAISNVKVNGEAVGEPYLVTGLTGRYLKRAELVFGQANQGGLSNEPIVSIEFNDEGATLFETITRDNVGEQLAIFLDGNVISAPRINEAIGGGKAIISGGFTPEEARELVRNLNFGALPVPIVLASTQSIGATLGERALDAGVLGSLVGLAAVSLFMILWYRLSGFVAALSLFLYVMLMLATFKFIPVTITAAGLAGLILSLGLAVDANILISERLKEELDSGKSAAEAIKIGFDRAWTSIRDGNVVNILSGFILYWFGDVFIEGFAFTLVIGTIISLISALVVSRTLLLAFSLNENHPITRFLLRSGLQK